MTNTDLLLIVAGLLALMVYYRSNLKQGKRPPKPRRPIRSRTRVRRRAVAFRHMGPTEEDMAFMRQKQHEQIEQSRNAQPTLATIAALQNLGVVFWREEPTWYDGDRLFLSDFWLPNLRVCLELNGEQHRWERDRDAVKAEIILEIRGFRTLEYWNREALRPDFAARLAKDLGL